MLKILAFCCGIFAVLGSPSASAHGLHGVSFMAGFVHPLLGFDHLLAMLAMGVSVAGLSVRGRWATAGLIAVSLCAGFFSVSAAHISLPIEPLLAATLLSLGMVLLRKHALSAPLRVLLIAFFTYFHGFAHGTELPSTDVMLPFATGVVCASLGLFGLGIGLGIGLGRRFGLRHPQAQMRFGGLLGIAGLGFIFGA